MTTPGPLITLLTDFGSKDNYVGVMKGVILSLCPNARLVDVAHHVPPQDVASAAFLLDRTYGYFPQGTLHLAVVDPGVGTKRRGMVLEISGHTFVTPDNGLLTHILATNGDPNMNTYSIENDSLFLSHCSNTFHGRDVFAPVVARLAAGMAPESVGPRIENPVRFSIPQLKKTSHTLEGRIVYVDHFGNLVSNIPAKDVEVLAEEGEITITLGDTEIKSLSQSYEAANNGGVLAIIDGFNRLEVSIRNGNAAKILNQGIGSMIRVEKTTAGA
jgi:S-adenosyl-L-methionine hydrolase (adenosine-forming)